MTGSPSRLTTYKYRLLTLRWQLVSRQAAYCSSRTPVLSLSVVTVLFMRFLFPAGFLLLALAFIMAESSGTNSENSDTSSTSTVQQRRHILEGIHLPFEKLLHPHHHSHDEEQKEKLLEAEPVQLRFNGAGVRSISLFGWPFKIYVASLYHTAENTLTDAADVFAAISHHPMQLDFTFLRSVNQDKVTEAWKLQLEHSVEFTYEGFEEDRDQFVQSFGPIANGGTESVVLLQDGRTVMVDQGVPKGVIHNKLFQQAFLSMWFGSKAVAPDLKLGLLGRIGQFGLQPHTATVPAEGGSVGMEGMEE